MALHGAALRLHLGRYVAPADAEDLLQELWLRVWQRAEQWEGRGRPLAWLLAIATNLALNHLRGRREAVSLAAAGDDDPSETLASNADAILPGPEEQVFWRDQLDRVRAAVATLPAEKQAALRLVRLEGKSLQAAAQALGVPLGTLKSRLHHAHRMLMEQLEEEW
jgi:RNA polymerase sigma-70 factor (ECF subfamily)